MLAAVAMVARIGPLFWTRWLPPLHEGLASRFRAGWRAEAFILWSILGLALGYRAPALLAAVPLIPLWGRSEEHTSELQSLMRISYAVFCLKKKHKKKTQNTYNENDWSTTRR